MRDRIGTTEVNCRATEAMLATADVEWAGGKVRILGTPIVAITLGLAFTVARAFRATKDRAKATSTGAGVIARASD